jgi:autotransporter-associated beta strand protein
MPIRPTKTFGFHRSRALAIASLLALSVGATAAQPFTVVVLPDTQYYTRTEARNDLYFKGQTSWIAAQREARSIAFVMHLGDIQNDGNPYYARTDDIYLPDFTRPTGLVPDDAQFRRASEAIGILDAAGVPYSLLPGNHDFIDHNVKDEPIYYLQWFGPQRYEGMPTYGGASPATPTTPWAGLNTWHTFEAGGYRFLNLAMQFAPDHHDLAWAQSVINANPGLPTILSTHALLNTTGYQSAYRPINDLLVRNNPQVVMTLNGHITGAFRQTVTNIAGQPVHQMLSNYQFSEFPGYFNGAGYLRTLEFDVDAGIVRVDTYSPVADAFLTDAANRFTLPLDLRSRFGRPDEPGIRHTVTFQQGFDGYSRTVDTYVSAAAPSSSYGSAAGLWVDGDADTPGLVQPRQSLLRFDGLFGQDAIPAGAVIDSAALTIRTSTTPNSHSRDTIGLHRMLASWSGTSTWNSLGNGVTADGTEAILAPNAAFVPAVNGGSLTFDVTESLWAWGSGAPNRGWVFLPGGTDGWRFDSSEAAVPAHRPSLTVTYTVRAASADILIAVPGGSPTQAEAGFPAIVGAASVRKQGPGTVIFDGDNTYTGRTVIEGGVLVVGRGDTLRSSEIVVRSGGTLRLAEGVGGRLAGLVLEGGRVQLPQTTIEPLQLGSLSLESAAGGVLDVGRGRVVIGPGGPQDAVRDGIVAGRNGGTWDGDVGILSSAVADPAGPSGMAVGYRAAADGSTTIAWASLGDADLDGAVTTADLNAIITGGLLNTALASATWAQGDFDYDGLVTTADINSLLTTGRLNQGAYRLGHEVPGGAPGTLAGVPEPAGIGLAVIGGLAALLFSLRQGTAIPRPRE